MDWLPLGASLVAAALVTPAAIRSMTAAGHVRENYRGSRPAFPSGVVIVVAALIALAPVALLARLADWDVFEPGFVAATLYALGVALLGLIDDALGRSGETGSPRGWRGHFLSLQHGRLTTGVVKAAGTLGLAALVLSGPPLGPGGGSGRYLLAVSLLVLTTNLFNLLDLRPGRIEKAFVLLGLGLSLGASTVEPLKLMGNFAGAALVVGVFNLREEAMLGDTGSYLVGALAGLWLVLTLSTEAQVIALAIVIAMTVYGEFRSLGAIVERVPLLKQLDSLGRK